MLVEARTPEGDTLSVLLQNAETVKLIGPADGEAQQQGQQQQGQRQQQRGEEEDSSAAPAAPAAASMPAAAGGWRAIPVSSLREGDAVFVLPQHGARHTGISIEERVREV